MRYHFLIRAVPALMVVMVLTISAVPVLATDNAVNRLTNVGASAGFGAETDQVALPEAIGGIIKAVLSLVGAIFMAYIVYAGYLWMTASGDEEKIKKAKAIIRGSIIGIIVVLGAYIITIFVVDRFSAATGIKQFE